MLVKGLQIFSCVFSYMSKMKEEGEGRRTKDSGQGPVGATKLLSLLLEIIKLRLNVSFIGILSCEIRWADYFVVGSLSMNLNYK